MVCVFFCCVFFFFKQKTAYEIVSGDWSSDVCSSDLSIPYVSRVQNRRAAEGGVDGEDIEAAKVRGPIVLRTRDRAVTMEDYEHLAREAAPEVARVRCVTAGDGADAGGVRILVVPAAGSNDGRLRFEQLSPAEETLQRIAHRLEDSRV